MGTTPDTCHSCFMLDFGLARQFTKGNGEVRQVSILYEVISLAAERKLLINFLLKVSQLFISMVSRSLEKSLKYCHVLETP